MGFFSGSKQYNISDTGVTSPFKPGLSAFAAKFLPEQIGSEANIAATPFQLSMPAINARGLFDQQEAAIASPFANAVNQMFANVSGSMANRGFNNPENIGAVIGSAAQNVAPQFANLFSNMATQNMNNLWQLPLTTEQIRQSRLAQMQNLFGNVSPLLGGSSAGGTAGPGFGYAAGTSLFGGVGQGAGAAGTAKAIG